MKIEEAMKHLAEQVGKNHRPPAVDAGVACYQEVRVLRKRIAELEAALDEARKAGHEMLRLLEKDGAKHNVWHRALLSDPLSLLAERDARIKAEVWEEAAEEAYKSRPVFFTSAEVEAGEMDDDSRPMRIRKQMRKEINEAMLARAAALRDKEEHEYQTDKAV
jgi:hypothetical protein